jgi:hypothetical protein
LITGLRPRQQLFIDAVEAGDFCFLVVAQGCPVESGRLTAAFQPKLRASLKDFAEFGRVDVQFLRHATDIDAGASQVAVFGDRHPGAKTRRHARSSYPTRAGADHEQVVVIVMIVHGFFLFILMLQSNRLGHAHA